MKKALIFLSLAFCVQAAVARPLSLDEVLQQTAQTNPTLQAAYAQVRVADADLHQAYLFENPRLQARVMWPQSSGPPRNEYGLSYNIMDLFQRGARVSINRKRRDATLLKTLRQAVEIEAELKKAYYTVQGHTQALVEQNVLLQIAEIDAELAQRQREAGNIAALDLAEKKAALLQTRTLYYNREMALFEARQELAELMGQAEKVASISVVSGPPDLPPESTKTSPTLLAEALLDRHDLQSRDKEIEALQADRKQQNLLMFDDTRLGYTYEKETDGETLQGVTLQMPLPLFDQRQAQKEHLEALADRERAQRTELSQEITSDINRQLVKMANARLRVEQLEELVPLRKEILELSRQQYNAMLIGAYQLLDFRGQGAVALLTLADAKADFWTAHADLERALGRSYLETTSPFTPLESENYKNAK